MCRHTNELKQAMLLYAYCQTQRYHLLLYSSAFTNLKIIFEKRKKRPEKKKQEEINVKQDPEWPILTHIRTYTTLTDLTVAALIELELELELDMWLSK